MRIILTIALGALLLFGQAMGAEQQKATKDMKGQKDKPSAAEQQKASKGIKSQKGKLSYSLGYMTGKRMKTESVDLDTDTFIKAFKDAYAGEKASMTDPEMQDAMRPLQEEMKTKRAEEMKKLSEKRKEVAEMNKKEGEEFLAENSKKEGVVTLPNGLQYKIIKEGTGRSPQRSDKVKVNYRGTLINGTEFDSSYKRGQPATLGVDKVIKGWTEALQLMKEGAQWTLYIPSDLAYGERGAGGSIGPGQTLVFEVELISIEQQ